MSERSSSTRSSTARTIDAALVALGFVRGADGTLIAPVGANITFAPIGQFLKLRFELGNGTAVEAVLHRTALKICTGSSTSARSQLGAREDQ